MSSTRNIFNSNPDNAIITSSSTTSPSFVLNDNTSSGNLSYLIEYDNSGTKYGGLVRKATDGEYYIANNETDKDNLSLTSLGTLNASTINADNIFSKTSTTINSINLKDNSIILNQGSTVDNSDTGVYFQHSANSYTGIMRDVNSGDFNLLNLTSLPSSTNTTINSNQLHNLKLKNISVFGNEKIYNSAGFQTTINANASQASDLTLTLPLNAGGSNQILTTDGSGNLSWKNGDQIAIGTNSATNNGSFAVAIGSQAGQGGQQFQAVAVGYNAGRTNQGNQSLAIGSQSGNNNQSSQAIAVGLNAGNQNQQQFAVAMGLNAGYNSQKSGAIAIGNTAGQNSQGNQSIAIGTQAGFDSQLNNAVSIGNQAGQLSQGERSIAIGNTAGQSNQRSGAVAMGHQAGCTNQGSFSVAIGFQAGNNNQSSNCIAIGYQSASNNQAGETTAVGSGSGNNNQQVRATCLGFQSGYYSQGTQSVAIGHSAGYAYQGRDCIAIGYQTQYTGANQYAISMGSFAGKSFQGTGAIAIGLNSGGQSQGQTAVAIGFQAGFQNQTYQAVAIGENAGNINQGVACTAIAVNAGQANQGYNSVAIGPNAGRTNQANSSVAIGNLAGSYNQDQHSIAIGNQAAQDAQGYYSIAIGDQAGQTYQGRYSIAIGNLASPNFQANQSICLNASSLALHADYSGMYARPLRTGINTGGTKYLMLYDTSNWEISYSTVSSALNKTFVIDHPIDKDKYLIHACLEGPEAGVYYRGDCEIYKKNNRGIFYENVYLPDYVSKLATDLTINTSIICEDENDIQFNKIVSSKIKNNSFTIYADKPCNVNWLVMGKRSSIQVEVDKNKVELNGSGPYKWISPK